MPAYIVPSKDLTTRDRCKSLTYNIHKSNMAIIVYPLYTIGLALALWTDYIKVALSLLFAALTAASSGGGKIHDAKRQITAVPSSTPTVTPSTTTRTTPTVNVSFASSLL